MRKICLIFLLMVMGASVIMAQGTSTARININGYDPKLTAEYRTNPESDM